MKGASTAWRERFKEERERRKAAEARLAEAERKNEVRRILIEETLAERNVAEARLRQTEQALREIAGYTEGYDQTSHEWTLHRIARAALDAQPVEPYDNGESPSDDPESGFDQGYTPTAQRSRREACPACEGAGVVDENGNPSVWGQTDSRECAMCDGSGWFDDLSDVDQRSRREA